MIVDCEVHVFPRNFDGYTRCHVEDLVADMDRCGVDRGFLTFYSDSTLTSVCGEIEPGSQRYSDSDEETWDYFRESWLAHQDRFFFFRVPDPREPNCIEQLEACCELGLHGIGETQPASQNILPNGPEFMPVYRFAADNGLPVVLTMERWEWTHCYRAKDFDDYFSMFESVIREFSDVRFMISHAGDCGTIVEKDWTSYLASNRRCFELAAELENLWICSCMPWWFDKNKVHPLLEQQLKFLKEHVGFSRVTWASDWPYSGGSTDFCFKSDYATVVDAYRNLGICDQEELDSLLGGAACEFVTGRKGVRV